MIKKDRFKLVRCRSCGTLQTFDLWKGKTEKKFKSNDCCCECGKKRYILNDKE